MKRKLLNFVIALFCSLSISSQAQTIAPKEKMNDFNTPLHLMKPEYKTPYGVSKPEEVKAVIDRVLTFLENATPTKVINKDTKAVITDFSKIDKNSVLERGTFRLASYEWGVTYAGMLLAAQTTGDKRYTKYVSDRFSFLAAVAPYFEKLRKEGIVEPQMRQVLHPEALDDAGAMCSAMIKAQNDGVKLNTRPLIDNYPTHKSKGSRPLVSLGYNCMRRRLARLESPVRHPYRGFSPGSHVARKQFSQANQIYFDQHKSCGQHR
ncbi:MAG: hypothetical protein WCJ61_06330 [Paludibacter sp.]